MNKLTQTRLSISVPGKIILIGEHSVVYGCTAIAMPLSGVRLTFCLEPIFYDHWKEVWNVKMLGQSLKLTEHFKNLLTQSFELALSLFEFNLSDFTPQALSIDSAIPLGGGMGGSAAVAASMVRICSKLFNRPLDIKTEIEYANKIDSLFHAGRVIGLP